MDDFLRWLAAWRGVEVEPGAELEAKNRLGRIGFDRVLGYVDRPFELLLAHQDQAQVASRLTPVDFEERRKDLTKRARAEGEHARVSVRNARKDANDFIKAAKADGLSEDLAKDGEAEVQKLTDSYVKRIDDILAKKESDIMTV